MRLAKWLERGLKIMWVSLNMCALGGGNWDNNTIAGVWTRNLNNVRNNANNNVGGGL